MVKLSKLLLEVQKEIGIKQTPPPRPYVERWIETRTKDFKVQESQHFYTAIRPEQVETEKNTLANYSRFDDLGIVVRWVVHE